MDVLIFLNLSVLRYSRLKCFKAASDAFFLRKDLVVLEKNVKSKVIFMLKNDVIMLYIGTMFV